jgi:RNA polymerase primary sigma factor
MMKVGGFVEVRYGIHRFAVNLMGYSFSDRGTAVSRYLSEISDTPILSEQEEQELAALLAGRDKTEAVNKLVESNLKFVVKIASEFRNPDIPFEDLLNEGNIGLIEAARRFDSSRGTRFISYAVWWIRRSILLALSRHSDLVRIPSYQVKKVRQLRAIERTLSGELGRKPNREEISQKLRSTIAGVDHLLQVRRQPLSLDDKIGRDKDTPISDGLVDQGAENPEKRLLREESRVLIGLALKELSEQERTVIINRFGLEDGRTLTLKEVGERLGITAERVRQIKARATKRMRRLIARNWATHSTSKQAPCVAVRRLVGSLHEA